MPAISALLDALKRSESKFGVGKDDEDEAGEPIAAKLSILHAKPVDGSDPDADGDTDPTADAPDDTADSDSGEDAEQNAAIVSALQDQYPQIYSKLLKSVSQPSDDQGDGADMGSSLSDDDLKGMMG